MYCHNFTFNKNSDNMPPDSEKFIWNAYTRMR
jgi:hypothetical protein